MNREQIKNKQRIVVKVGSSTLTHESTGNLNLMKVEKLVRVLSDIHNSGKDVILVSSGAIAVGRKALGIMERPKTMPVKQACAAVGQARLMMTYQKIFAEYNQIAAQILMTKYTMTSDDSRINAQNTFAQLLAMGVIPVVNENDTVSTHEIEFGDNDKLSAIVTAITGADLLILLSDIDGLFTDDPNKNPDAEFVEEVPFIDETLMNMGKGSASSVGTGGMAAKLEAARIATDSGADMIITNGDDIGNLERIMNGEKIGTLFLAHKNPEFNVSDML
ncbi:MAG: glutamate 5-kinase [Lachnospiraceae bacterium]